MAEMKLRVASIRNLAPRIRAFELRDPAGRLLPEPLPGCHIDLELPLPGADRRRSYSIVSGAATRDLYEIAVLREASGRGGSAWMHDHVATGDLLDASLTKNGFPLAADAASHLLVAGGIGVTPILSMIRHLDAVGAEYEVHYCARAPELMAYRDEIAALAGARAFFHFDGGDPSRGLDLAALLAARHPKRHLYVCGPFGMNVAAIAAARRAGWPSDALHQENFAPPPPEAADRPIELVLNRSGRTLLVPSGQTILDALIEAGEDPIYDCKAGDCGVCATKVLEGEPEHRDHVLSAAEKDAREMCICVSRAIGPRLMLDL